MAASITLVPGAAGDGRAADRPPAHPGHEPPGRRSRPRRSRRAGAAPCSGARGSPRSPARPSLLALASPVTGLRLGFPDRGNDRARHHDAPGLRARLARLRPRRQRAAAARRRRPRRPRRDGPRWPASCAASRASPAVSAPAVEPARRRGGADRRAAHVAAGRRDRGPRSTTCATTCCRGAGVPVAASAARRPRSWTRAARPRSGCRCSSAASSVLVVPAAARELPLGHRRREGGADEPALDRRGVRRRGATWPRAAGRGSSSASTRRRPCRRSSR